MITGASSGIGAATARALAGPGAELHLLGRRAEALAEVAAAVREAGATAFEHELDLLDDAGLRAFAGATPGGPLDLLVHSAGTVQLGAVAELDVGDLDAQYRLNVRVPFLLTQALLPRLREARGLVVMVNSGAGQNARATWGGYAASKFALRGLADSLRAEEAANGVRVSSVFPGRTATPMQREVRAQEGGAYDPEAYVDPAEVAAAIALAARMDPSATVPEVSVRPA